MDIKNRAYKMWLLQEGKDESGIVNLLLQGIGEQNEMALDVLIESGAPDVPFLEKECFNRAAKMILEIKT